MRKIISLLLLLVLSGPCLAVPVTIGGSVGLLARATSLNFETRWHLPYTPGITSTAWRLGLGYAQSADSTRRYVPVYSDLVFNFPAGYITPFENYFGLGFNYVVKTSGGSAGTIGPEIFYGVESSGFGGRMFGEIGLANLRTGFAEEHSGTTLLVGWRSQVAY